MWPPGCSTDFLSGSNIRIKYKSNNLIQCILVNCVAQSAAANISKASAVLLLQNVPTAVAVTRRMRKSGQDTEKKLKYSN